MLSKPNVSVAMPVQSISHKLLVSRIEWHAQEVDVYLKEFGKSFRATISPSRLLLTFCHLRFLQRSSFSILSIDRADLWFFKKVLLLTVQAYSEPNHWGLSPQKFYG